MGVNSNISPISPSLKPSLMFAQKFDKIHKLQETDSNSIRFISHNFILEAQNHVYQEAPVRIIIGGPYLPPNAIIYMRLQ